MSEHPIIPFRGVATDITARIQAAQQHEEKVIRLLVLIKDMQPGITITFEQLNDTLLRTGISPELLYHQTSAGQYTHEMARLDAELGLPVKSVTAESVGGYWQRQLVEIAKQQGQSQEIIDRIDADLENALRGGFDLYFESKEELARSIVQLYGNMAPAMEFKRSMQQLIESAGTVSLKLQKISSGILALAEETPAPPPKKAKTPYYQKNKGAWWK